jgi:hypothetical protein
MMLCAMFQSSACAAREANGIVQCNAPYWRNSTTAQRLGLTGIEIGKPCKWLILVPVGLHGRWYGASFLLPLEARYQGRSSPRAALPYALPYPVTVALLLCEIVVELMIFGT